MIEYSRIFPHFLRNTQKRRSCFSFIQHQKLFNNMSYFGDFLIPFHSDCLLWFHFSHVKIAKQKVIFISPGNEKPKPFLLLKNQRGKNYVKFPTARAYHFYSFAIHPCLYVYFNDCYSNEERIHDAPAGNYLFIHFFSTQQNASETNRRKMERNFHVKYK